MRTNGASPAGVACAKYYPSPIFPLANPIFPPQRRHSIAATFIPNPRTEPFIIPPPRSHSPSQLPSLSLLPTPIQDLPLPPPPPLPRPRLHSTSSRSCLRSLSPSHLVSTSSSLLIPHYPRPRLHSASPRLQPSSSHHLPPLSTSLTQYLPVCIPQFPPSIDLHHELSPKTLQNRSVSVRSPPISYIP